MNDVLIKVDHLSKKYCRNLKRSLWYGVQDIGRELLGLSKRVDLRKDEFLAVNNVSFELKRGEALGIIGPNGAGKSSLLKVLNGLIKPEAGRVEISGRIGALIQLGAGFNPILTGRENIYVNAAVLGITKTEVDDKLDEIIEFSELATSIDSPVQTYSSGMKVRLGFSIAAHMKPDVLIIDEVLAVGDVGFRNKCFAAIKKLSKEAAVIFVSHNVHMISRLCDQVLVMDQGKKVFHDSNVAEGIDCYLSLFNNQEGRTENVTGAEVNDIHVNGELLSPEHTVNHNEQLSVQFEAKLPEQYKDLKIILSFSSLNGEKVAACLSVNDGFEIRNDGTKRRFSVTIPNLLLGVAKCYLNLYIAERETNFAPIRMHAITCINIKKEGDYIDAPALFKAEWK